jgi:hypothetical protein
MMTAKSKSNCQKSTVKELISHILMTKKWEATLMIGAKMHGK